MPDNPKGLSFNFAYLPKIPWMEVPQSTVLLLNIPSSFYYSSVYLVTPMTFPQKATNRITHVFSFWFLPMSSMWEVFHTTIAITKLNQCISVGTNLFVFRKAAVPLLLKVVEYWRKALLWWGSSAKRSRKLHASIRMGHHLLAMKIFIFAELKVTILSLWEAGRWHTKIM